MPDISLLDELLREIRKSGIKVISRPNRHRVELPTGVYFLEEATITLYYRNRQEEWEYILAVLLHEYGHHIAYEKIGKNHTEEDAWDIVEKELPKKYFLKTFYSYKKECLASYEEYEKYRVRKILKQYHFEHLLDLVD